jgi:hypothetical protein
MAQTTKACNNDFSFDQNLVLQKVLEAHC